MLTKNHFNQSLSSFVCLDINSCFASVEQQANPFLRNKPVVVTAYSGRNGCVLAASIQAKKLGIKTAMRLSEAKKLCPTLSVLPSDPNKYRFVHKQIKNILLRYTPYVSPKSIDEFILDFSDFSKAKKLNLVNICKEIKSEVASTLGEYITVSIGIAPSAYLAKVASNLKKPNGLEEINAQNFLSVYQKLSLTDLTGIATKTATRLNLVGIYTVMDMYQADLNLLKRALKTALSSYWYQRLRGFDAGVISDITKSVGHTYTLPKASGSAVEVRSILVKLVEKVATRLRKHGFVAHGLSLGVRYQNREYFHKAKTTKNSSF